MKDAQEYKGRIDFGILMARQDELEAALDNRFEILDNARGLRTHVITRVATRDGGEYLLSLTRCSDQGHGPAYEVADAIITDLDPQWLIVVGIGGAVPADEFSLGDVLVANVVPDFSLQAANEGKPPTFDLRGGEVHPKVLDLVAHLPTMRNALAGWNTKQSIRVPLPRLDLPRLNSDALYGPEDWQKKLPTHQKTATATSLLDRAYWDQQHISEGHGVCERPTRGCTRRRSRRNGNGRRTKGCSSYGPRLPCTHHSGCQRRDRFQA